jgi:molecular chaperone DnaJ
MKNYYDILGIPETATQDDIKKAYRKLSKQYHPDVNPKGEEKFKEVSEAYENIGEETKRNEYDNRRNNPFGSFDINSMFGGAFNDMMRNSTPKAPDKVMDIFITPIESYFGAKKEIELNTFNRCKPCEGTGGEKKICDTCKGHGVVFQVMGTGMFRQQIRMNCPTCNGNGSILLSACGSCFGRGVTQEKETFSVSIPSNVDNGDFMRMKNKGDYHNKLNVRGDLILKVNMLNTDNYEKSGTDLVYHKKVDPISLVINDTMTINHPDGDLMINIPKNMDTDKPLRITNKGYITPNGRGNFYIRVSVQKTDDIDQEIKEKIKELLKQPA